MYQKYDNFDALNVDRVKDIPMDYEGVMGVPITYLDKYNPDQFELIGILSTRYNKNLVGIDRLDPTSGEGRGLVNGKLKYSRILIKRK